MAIQTFQSAADRLPKFSEIEARFGPQSNINAQLERSLSPVEHLAVWVTDRVGSMGFFFLIAAWTVFWLAWNTVGPAELRFDPGPAFVLWLFISNLIQLHLVPLIMVSQNLQDRYTELRAEADFEVNKKAEAEVGMILSHLSHQNDLMLEILRRVERMEQSRAR